MRCEEDISGGSWILCPEDAGLHREVHSMIADRDLGGGRGAHITPYWRGREGLGVGF